MAIQLLREVAGLAEWCQTMANGKLAAGGVDDLDVFVSGERKAREFARLGRSVRSGEGPWRLKAVLPVRRSTLFADGVDLSGKGR